MMPVVLHHGFFGFGNFSVGPLRYSYFHRIDRAISRLGHPLIVSRVHPTAGIATRARQLKEIILRQMDILSRDPQHDGKVILIGHSMGGLDARYMISKLGMADRIAALLTVSCPHRGTAYADWCLKHLGQRLGGLQLMKFIGLDVQSVSDVSQAHSARFNEEVPDDPGVKYFSVSAARPWHRVPPFMLHAYKIVYDAEGENDCLISVQSAKWGTHLGTWPADHFHTINKRFVVELKDPTGDITPYYLSAIRTIQEHLHDDAQQAGRATASVDYEVSPATV